MSSGDSIGFGARSAWIGILVLLAAMAAPNTSHAQFGSSVSCSDFPVDSSGRYVLDGDVFPGASSISQINVNNHCTIRNFPASNPLGANMNFNAPGGGEWLVIFDNVVHTGQWSCNQNDTHRHKIWYVNSSSNRVQQGCRDAFIPVEKIDKKSPSPAATIGVPFTYTMTIPVLFQPGGDGPGTVIDWLGSENDLHGVTIWDDLNATGADLTLVGYEIYWRDSGDPVPHLFTNDDGFLTWEIGDLGVIIQAGDQFVIELTVVLNDTPANAPGTVFVNRADWDFGRIIEFDSGPVFFEPLPGEAGISQPMRIAAPQLIVTKTGPATLGRTLNLGQWGEFAIDVYNTDGGDNSGVTDAWDVTLLDLFPPSSPTGGMCQMTPEILSAQVFQTDGVTPVAGKGPLEEGTDFTVTWTGAPACELTLTMLTSAAVIGPGERLIVTYQSQIDPNTQDGITLTNVAGAVEWFNDDSSNAERVTYTRTLTNGTPGVPDHEDDHSFQVALYGFFFEKTVANLTNGADPATMAAPGSLLRYTLRLQATDVPLESLSFRDDLGRMNPTSVFVPGSLTVVTLPPGAVNASNPTGGTNSAGLLDIRNIDVPTFSEVIVQFEILLQPNILNGTWVINQAELWDDTSKLADSDDPNVNGQADPDIAGDEDPTRILVQSQPEFVVEKVSEDIDGDPDLLMPGERLRYTITVRNVGTSDAADVVFGDPIPEHTTYVPGSTRLNGAAVADGAGGTPPFLNGMLISTPLDPTPGFMPADATPGVTSNVATIVFEVRVDPGTADGTLISNQAFVSSPEFQIIDRPSDDPRTPAIDDPTVDLVGDVPFLYAVKQAELEIDETQLGIVDPGDVLRYTITIYNNGRSPATGVVLSDPVPLHTTYVANSLTLNGLAVGQPDGGIFPLIAGIGVASADLTPPLPGATGGTISAGEAAVVEFLLRVDGDVAPGTLIVNQAIVSSTDLDDQPTDNDGDPTNGLQPTVVVVGDVPIQPAFDVQKVSAYIDGDPALLLAGERLRYAITVRNVGTAHAHDAVFRDPIPANTAYVPGSTTINGTAVPDGPGGTAPFLVGMPIWTPIDPTPGYMPAAVLPGQDNTATIVFEVRVDPDTIQGTIISNQAFVSAPDGGVIDTPSDDPGTPAVNDPTRDIVGALPFLYAEKTAELEVDGASPGIVDPGDVLRYRITIHNSGNVAATDVVLRDPVPANTTYVADSLTLNGLAVGQPDGGVSPLVGGIGVASTDLTPPLPGATGGTISAGETAVVEFLLRVNDGVPSGTLIINQAVVESAELPNLLTDGDGNAATGPQPTIVVVGDVQQLAITKQVVVVGGGPALAGETVEYTVTVRNVAPVPAFGVVIRDDLDLPVGGQLTLVAGSASMNGSADGVSLVGSLLTADYAAVYDALNPGGSITLRFRAILDADLAIGTQVTNTATVSWNDPVQEESASVTITIGSTPGIGVLSGHVWHDANFDRVPDDDELKLAGWTVQFYRNDALAHSTQTAADGTYRVSGVAPNDVTGDVYELRFVRPGAGPNAAMLGTAHSVFTNDLHRISEIAVTSGSSLSNLNLPIDPNGIVYNSLTRTPIAGATLTLVRANGTPVPSSCFLDPAQQDQVTLADGFYKFDLSFSAAACPSGASYAIQVTPPSSAFTGRISEIIPPLSDETTGPFSVPSCPGTAEDAVPATAQHCEVVASAFAPPASVPARTAGTNYHLHLLLDNSQPPGSSQIFNNHIPLDLDLDDSLTITKTTPLVNVTRGQLVPYVITLGNGVGVDLTEVALVDLIPPGFRYIEGSGRLNGAPVEPVVNGRELVWTGLTVTTEGRQTLQLVLGVGSGVGEGEFVNRAHARHAFTGSPISGEATATVRIVPDPAFDCTDVIGKVFDDVNRNGVQDPGEPGISGARLVTARGLAATTDAHGRFHITCAITPREGRGSNFVLKLDDRTLPSGYRASTDNVQVQRATRGKALEFNFGASIHRVIGLDLADAVFVPDTAEMRRIWRPRMDLLIDELRVAPAVLRLSYLADLEEPRLVEQRLEMLKREITAAWRAGEDCCSYELAIETEVFWHRGAPLSQPERRRRAGR